ncbi:MFS transporter [Streptomyces sp. 142MFCol3.1]|uniref:MFS transporter n=1 Tax=Streptomyces sp. 142MFCol3.1 TaxID=1172179 RepID=UPI001319CA2D|nr:MFS transporter [Streptomyces sp. 142MFCol3.1]
MLSAQRGSGRRWVSLAVILAGAFMAILDVAVVNVAMPSIHSDLHTSLGAVELVVSSYTLLYASFLVTGGRLGDVIGRKSMFITGLAVFTAASALCGLAPDIHVLVAARALQGVGGALLYPQVLAIIQVTFEGPERARALGVFGCVVGVGAIAGQIVGGLLLAWNVFGLDWRPAFLINVPIGVATIVASRMLLPPDEPPRSRPHLDGRGSALSVLTLVLLIVPLLMGRDAGWPLWMLLSLAAAPLIAVLFLRHERAVAERGLDPLIRLSLFRNRGFAGGVPIAGMFSFSYVGFMLVLALYLQIGLGFSPLHAALVYTPNAVGFLITSLLAARIARLLGRHVLTLGYLVAAVGLCSVAATSAAQGAGLSGWELGLPMFIAGLGQGLGMTPLIGTIIGTLAPRDAGAGAGVVTTTLQVGNALGVALMSLLFFAVLGDGTGHADYATAFSQVLPVAALVTLIAAFMVTRLPRGTGAGNALLERLPGHTVGFAYSMYLMTGGRIGDRLFHEILGHVTERREREVREAPSAAGDFFVYHFESAHHDAAWLTYLTREALAYGSAPVPHEEERRAVIKSQVDEIRRRQCGGELRPELDPELLRLLTFALTNYPRLLPQITRMATGLGPDDPGFTARWELFLQQLGDLLHAGPPTTSLPRVSASSGGQE